MNLLEVLTSEDRVKIENYARYYGGANGGFTGVDVWLRHWAKANQKLYRLLGNKLIVSFPYTYEKNNIILTEEIYDLISSDLGADIKTGYYEYFRIFCKNNDVDWNDVHLAFKTALSASSLCDNAIGATLKYSFNGKHLQLTPEMKPMRALNKINKFLQNFIEIDKDFLHKVELFRQKHSAILTDKIVKTECCISIHPLDFMTMSDNANGWSSCMSWKNQGCYHLGTVEMMNSNVVLCAYFKSNCNYEYPIGENGAEHDTWNSKKWRQLIYVNKDILLAGKAYPYENVDFTKHILSLIKNLAQENMNWSYTYGPEKYKDMLGVNSLKGMHNARYQIFNKDTNMRPKGRIIIDTKAMYNDMLNDSDTNYWCYRNIPKKPYILQVSGKAHCLNCDTDLQYIRQPDYDDYDDYNDRYDAKMTICQNCFDEVRCECCCEDESAIGIEKRYYVHDIHGGRYRLCEHHFLDNIHKCPLCDNYISRRTSMTHLYYGSNYKKANTPLSRNQIELVYKLWKQKDDDILLDMYNKGDYIPFVLCDYCIKKHNFKVTSREVESLYSWYHPTYQIVQGLSNLTDEEAEKLIRYSIEPRILKDEDLAQKDIYIMNSFYY